MLRTSWARQKPLIAVTGPTGTGKSQLAIHLAHRFGGEIVNADALQIYRGLPVATNKLSRDESKGITHHLLGVIDIWEPPWTVTKYVREAEKLIKEIHARGKIPIIVGGTHYYIRALLCADCLVPQTSTEVDVGDQDWPILEASTDAMLRNLQEIDPVAASWWHPRERSKIRHSLSICLQTGQKVSDIYQRQNSSRETSDGNILKYDVLCLCLDADRGHLNTRLYQRVDRMMNTGLLDEAQLMRLNRKVWIERGLEIDTTRGIWIAIGFKEFEAYLDSLEITQNNEGLEAMKLSAQERTKISTRQYAVRQVRYVKHKILPLFQKCPERGLFQILDASCLESWHEKVAIKAEDLTNKFLLKHPLPDPVNAGDGISSDWFGSKPAVKQNNFCEICKVTTTTHDGWEKHVRSKRHAAAQKKLFRCVSPGNDKMSKILSTDV